MTDAPQKTLDELAAEIRSLSCVTDDNPRRGVHLNICNAQHHASNCAVCAKKLRPSEPVWRARLMNPWGNIRVAPVCKKCSERNRRSNFEKKPKPCGGCGRLVHNVRRYDSWRDIRRGYSLTFCCDDCRSKAVSKMARELRTKARGKHKCDECDKTFTPTRTDSKFCSSPCRQKAYRQRVTDSKPRAGRHSKSRNGIWREVRA